LSKRPPLNLLMAYPYVKADVLKLLLERRRDIRLLVDSGAFTAWKLGKPIKLDDYCRFLESLPVKPWRYFMLDVVGDPKTTLENYALMLKRGFNPIPIFTRGECPSVLDDYYKTSDVVGLGGIGQKEYVKGIMKHVGSRKCHWLGFTNLSFIKYFKPYMADSSSWNIGARYASCPLYLGRGQSLIYLQKKNVRAQLRNPQIVNAIQSLGLNPNDLMKTEKWNGGQSVTFKIGARSMRRLTEDVQTKLGTNLFLAAATKAAVEILLEES